MKLLVMQFPPISRSVQIFSSAPCSQTPSVCVSPLMLETEFRTHTEPNTTYTYRSKLTSLSRSRRGVLVKSFW
jgi:hypothetical protein